MNKIIILIAFIFSQMALAASLKITVTSTCMNNVIKPVKEAFEKKTGIQLEVLDGSTSDGVVKHLEAGDAPCLCTVGSLEDTLKTAEEKGVKIKSKDAYRQRVIGRDRIAIYVDKMGPGKLSDAQITDILSGKMTSWKSITGKDAPIRLVLMEQTAANNLIKKKFLANSDFASGANVIQMKGNTPPLYLEKIAATPGGIGFLSSSFSKSNPGVKVPEHGIIGRPMSVVWTSEKPTAEMEAFMSFVINDGSKYGVFQ